EFDMFWSYRKQRLPVELRLEDNSWDVGLKPLKQNWFRGTGQVLMIDNYYTCFKNDYYDTCLLNKQQELFNAS
ncbi:MAG TPA: hypothetical protein DEG69_05435, partial [Flavobacteriaceae bacterium]|nr:hypothetical protein [Flavobacteriaceae bacterium]